MKLLFLSFALVSSAFASETVFTCKESKARAATVLAVSPSEIVLGDFHLLRDRHYIPGNKGKSYFRYSNDSMDVLVPKLMAKNKTNQGVVIVYTQNEKIRLSCLK